jgi:hypothetical protein
MNEMSPLRIFPLRSAALQKAPVDKTVRYCFLNADSQLRYDELLKIRFC